MQDRYAGDIGDFGKIGLLKVIQAQGLSVAVNWYRVEPLESEKKADGTYKQNDGKHLIPNKYYDCDKDLAERLSKIAQSGNRSISSLENADLIPDARYYSDAVTVENRTEWHNKALEQLKDADVVFVDPDNGMLVKSVGKKSAKSVKYTFYEEVEDYLRQEHRQSVLIYNHRCRKPKDVYFNEICGKLKESVKKAGVQDAEILRITFPKCSVRDYFAVPASKDHYEKLRAAFLSMENSVWGDMGVCRIPV